MQIISLSTPTADQKGNYRQLDAAFLSLRSAKNPVQFMELSLWARRLNSEREIGLKSKTAGSEKETQN